MRSAQGLLLFISSMLAIQSAVAQTVSAPLTPVQALPAQVVISAQPVQASVSAQSLASSAPSLVSTAIEPTEKDIPNYFKINENLYRGGHPSETGIEDLAKLGVRTVIDLEGGDLHSALDLFVRIAEKGELKSSIEKEGNEVRAQGLNFINYPLDSLNRINRPESAMISKILNDLQDPNLQPVFVHCEHGKDRTGLIVALERVEHEGWSVEDARAEWIAFGHGFINRILTGGLDQYFKIVTESDP